VQIFSQNIKASVVSVITIATTPAHINKVFSWISLLVYLNKDLLPRFGQTTKVFRVSTTTIATKSTHIVHNFPKYWGSCQNQDSHCNLRPCRCQFYNLTTTQNPKQKKNRKFPQWIQEKNKKQKTMRYESKPEGPQLADSVHQAWYLPKELDPSSASRTAILSFPPSDLKIQTRRLTKNNDELEENACVAMLW